MQILKSLICLGLFAGLAALPLASAQDAPSFEGAVVGASIAEIMAATPSVDWRTFTRSDTNALVGAVGNSFTFNGQRWSLQLGRTSNLHPKELTYNFSMSHGARYDEPTGCQAEFGQLVVKLEPLVGAYRGGSQTDISGYPNRVEPMTASAGTSSTYHVFENGKTSYSERTTEYIAVRDVEFGPARTATVYASNVQDPVKGRDSYLCQIGFTFKTLTPATAPEAAAAPPPSSP